MSWIEERRFKSMKRYLLKNTEDEDESAEDSGLSDIWSALKRDAIVHDPTLLSAKGSVGLV